MAFEILELTCNYMENPIGMDDTPYFSYQLKAGRADDVLSAYSIKVYNKTEVVWDSGRVSEDKQLFIKYNGKLLQPETRYFWKVTVWNARNEQSESEEAYFETGRKKEFQWEAKWITADPQPIFIGNKIESNTTAPYIRREFVVDKPVKEATLYIAGLGYYECYVNGVSVKDTVLDPAFTVYDQAVMYRTHKIANIKEGKNVIGIILGDGFYNADTEDTWNFVNAPWRDHAKCICVLSLQYQDGTRERIVSDRTFKGTKGPILANDVRTLEKYDARLELGDWTMPEYDDSKWETVTITKAPGGKLVGQYTTPIRIVDEYLPQSIRKCSDTMWLIDVGFNTAGWAEISMTAQAGTMISLHYGEEFDEKLEHMRAMNAYVKGEEQKIYQSDCYIAKGNGIETWHPLFHYHGFRYIVVTCESGIPENFHIKIQEVRTDLQTAGTFSCSNKVMNQIQEMTCRSTRTNFHGFPTDCPHREKNGWTADAHLSAEQLLYNFKAAAAYDRWLEDFSRVQRETGQLPGIVPSTGWGFNWGSGPAWDSACVIIPYTMYLYGGDVRVLEKMYPCMKKYIAFCDTMAIDDICEFGLPDWCAPSDAWHKQCELAVTDTAYYYYDVVTVSKIATLLGFADEAEIYATKATEIRESFRRAFIKQADEVLELHCTQCQTSLGCMLYFDLVEESEKPLFLHALRKEIEESNHHFDVGILGAKYVCNALLEAGEAELMLKAALNPTYPSWGNWVERGATTLWEEWDGRSSQNHHMFGDISACFYKGIAGLFIDEKRPAFRHTIFKPQFVSMVDEVSAEHISPYGKVASAWKREGNQVTLWLTVPANCTGELVLAENAVVSKEINMTFGAGMHQFSFEIKI